MIKSLSRLVRQVFVGARAHPTSEAIMGADGRPAHDAGMRHEDLKRAMEIAFAAPASPLEPETGVIVEMATGHDVVADISPQASLAEDEVIVSASEANPSWDDAVEPAEEAVAAVAETVEEVAEAPLEEVSAEAAIETESVSEAADERVVVEAEADLDPLPIEDADALLEDAIVALGGEFAADDVVSEEVATDEEAMAEAAAADEALAAADDAAVEDVLAAAPAKPARAKKAAAKKKKAAPRKKSASKKSPKAAAELPEDAVWISDAVGYTLSGAWSSAWSPPEDGAGVERLEEFRAKATEGALAVWGRVEGDDEWAPIKASTWKSIAVEPLSFLMGRENVTTEAKSAKSKAKTYVGLKVSKARVEELWPVASGEEVRDAA